MQEEANNSLGLAGRLFANQRAPTTTSAEALVCKTLGTGFLRIE